MTVNVYPNNINSDDGIEIYEAWMPSIKKHNNRRAVSKRTAVGTIHEHRGSKRANHSCEKKYTITAEHPAY